MIPFVITAVLLVMILSVQGDMPRPIARLLLAEWAALLGALCLALIIFG